MCDNCTRLPVNINHQQEIAYELTIDTDIGDHEWH